MGSKMIIFDLDMTLVDTSIAEEYRSRRDWNAVYSLIPTMEAYEEMVALARMFSGMREYIAVVTNSPRSYAEKVLRYFEVPHDVIVGYWEVARRKPHVEPYLKASAGVEIANPSSVFVFGDRAEDITPARSLGYISCACLWGAVDKKGLVAAGPTFIFESPASAHVHFLNNIS